MHNNTPMTRHDAVVLLRSRDHLPEHEAVILQDIARRIAGLLNLPFDGEFDPTRHAGKHCYVVPSDTLVGDRIREQLHIANENDLFGGCAAYPFMPTKAISHGLLHANAERPPGWSDAFSEKVKAAVLPGYTAFSLADLREATQRLLDEHQAIRLKPVLATAGRGQVRIRHINDLEDALAGHDAASLATHGVVVETDLEDVVTYSVGQTRLPGLKASYIGTQCMTQDNQGEPVYGGSSLQFSRGDYSDLLQQPLSEECRQAIELARQYDAAADACYPGFFASRRNYDVAAGRDAKGRHRVGVLEQSWRVGGASRAEIAALEAFSADPECQRLRAETLERFGAEADIPPHAMETFAGEDPDLGLIRKYVMVEAYGNKQ